MLIHQFDEEDSKKLIEFLETTYFLEEEMANRGWVWANATHFTTYRGILIDVHLFLEYLELLNKSHSDYTSEELALQKLLTELHSDWREFDLLMIKVPIYGAL